MSGSAKAGTIAERHACELRVLPEFAGARSSEARFRRIFFSLTKTYMDVRFCEGRNHRREARVRAAGSARVRRCALLRSALQENLFLLDKDLHGCPVLRRQEPSPRGTRASCGFCQSSPVRAPPKRASGESFSP